MDCYVVILVVVYVVVVVVVFWGQFSKTSHLVYAGFLGIALHGVPGIGFTIVWVVVLVVVVMVVVVVAVFVVIRGPFSKTDHVVYARFLEIGVFWKSWLPHVGKTISFRGIIACRASWGTLRLQVLGWMPETARRKLAVVSP